MDKDPARKRLIGTLEQDITRLESGLRLFDANVMSILGHQIDLLAIADDPPHFVMIQLYPEKIAPQAMHKETLKLLYLWYFVCYFKDDFREVAEESYDAGRMQVPPRLILVVPEITSQLWSYIQNLKDNCLNIDVFRYNETVRNGGTETIWLKCDWPEEIKPLPASTLRRFDADRFKMAEDERHIYEQLMAIDPSIKGYDRQKSWAKALAHGRSVVSDEGVSTDRPAP